MNWAERARCAVAAQLLWRTLKSLVGETSNEIRVQEESEVATPDQIRNLRALASDLAARIRRNACSPDLDEYLPAFARYPYIGIWKMESRQVSAQPILDPCEVSCRWTCRLTRIQLNGNVGLPYE